MTILTSILMPCEIYEGTSGVIIFSSIHGFIKLYNHQIFLHVRINYRLSTRQNEFCIYFVLFLRFNCVFYTSLHVFVCLIVCSEICSKAFWWLWGYVRIYTMLDKPAWLKTCHNENWHLGAFYSLFWIVKWKNFRYLKKIWVKIVNAALKSSTSFLGFWFIKRSLNKSSFCSC